MSQIHDVLKSGKYKATTVWDRNEEFHLYIKADTFYCDEREKGDQTVRSSNLHLFPFLNHSLR